jgi:hypothetical protein
MITKLPASINIFGTGRLQRHTDDTDQCPLRAERIGAVYQSIGIADNLLLLYIFLSYVVYREEGAI